MPVPLWAELWAAELTMIDARTKAKEVKARISHRRRHTAKLAKRLTELEKRQKEAQEEAYRLRMEADRMAEVVSDAHLGWGVEHPLTPDILCPYWNARNLRYVEEGKHGLQR